MPWGYTQPGNWKTTRKRILERDGHQCYICGAQAGQVDAIIPESQGGTHRDDTNLAAICEPCHARKTARERVAGQRARKTKVRAPHPGDIPPGA